MSDAPRGVAARLTKIELNNYRAFRGHLEIDLPNGCNLLVYGENGSGKSSLYNALTDFLESPNRTFYDEVLKRNRPLKVEDFRYRFGTDPASIRLGFSTPSPPGNQSGGVRMFEWSAFKNDTTTSEMRTVDKGKGCLDYRALLKVHLLPTGAHELNLFALFIDPLLAQYKNPASAPSLTFADEWRRIQQPFKLYERKPAELDEWIKQFNAGFERVAKDTTALASRLLNSFDDELGIEIDFVPASYHWGPKRLFPPKILARPLFRLLPHPDYHGFLNEARLSALAIALYFAGLEKSPAGEFRLLVLDDILIGLDMANRMTVLGIAERLFRQWQVIILTYHRAWFEILKARTRDGNWAHPWASVVLRTKRALGTESTIVAAESGELLSQARAHFETGDAKAAAVYARSAWEASMGEFCSEWQIPVPYAESRRELDTEAFLRSIATRLQTLRTSADREWAVAVLSEIRHARRFVLNPNAHYDSELEDEISAEISGAIRAVEDFTTLLRSIERADFGDDAAEESSVGALVVASLELFEGGRLAAALDVLRRAFELYLDEMFRSRKELIPYGIEVSPRFLFELAGRRGFFDQLTWRFLRHADPYLLAGVAPKHVDPTAFRVAARLLLRLRVLFLLAKAKAS